MQISKVRSDKKIPEITEQHKFPFNKLKEVGQSFQIKFNDEEEAKRVMNTLRATVSRKNKKSDKKFIVRKTKELKCRVWRTE